MKTEHTETKAVETTEAVNSSSSTPTPKKNAERKKRLAESQSVRPGTKKGIVLTLLKRPKGATLKELMKATGWQAHSVRGFLSGTVTKNMGLKLKALDRDGERAYHLKS